MGLDLTLLPIDSERVDEASAYSVLDFTRQNWLFALISNLPRNQLKVRFLSEYGDAGEFGETTADDPLNYCLAGDLRRLWEQLRSDPQKFREINHSNRAALAYCSELTDETKIVLYWSR